MTDKEHQAAHAAHEAMTELERGIKEFTHYLIYNTLLITQLQRDANQQHSSTSEKTQLPVQQQLGIRRRKRNKT